MRSTTIFAGALGTVEAILLFAVILIAIVAFILAGKRAILRARREQTRQEPQSVTLAARIWLALMVALSALGLGLEIWAGQAHSASGVAIGHVLIQSGLVVMLTGALAAVMVFVVSMARRR